LSDARLNGADLNDAHLEDAELRGANLKGVDLRHARLGGTDLSSALLTLSDLRDVSFDLLTAEQWEELRRQVADVVPAEPGTLVPEMMRIGALERINKAEGRRTTVVSPNQSGDTIYEKKGLFADWPDPLDTSSYDRKLAAYLADLACRDRDTAQGIIRRALEYRLGPLSLPPFEPRELHTELGKKLLGKKCESLKELSPHIRTLLGEVAKQ